MAQILVNPNADDVERARLLGEQRRLVDEARSRRWRPWKRAAALAVGVATVAGSTVTSRGHPVVLGGEPLGDQVGVELGRC